MRQETIAVDGLEIHLATAGEGEPLLFVHGLGSAGTSWAPQARALCEGYRTIAPDLPGFGRSAKPEREYIPAFFVDALAGVLDELGIDDAHVVGSSLGGHVSLELALRRPERVRRLVTVAPAGVPPASFAGTAALDTYRGIVEADDEDEVVAILEAIQPEGVDPPEHGRDPAEILAYVRSPGAKQAFGSALLESARARRLGPLLDEVQAPLLVVWGSEDPMIPWEECRPVLAETSHPVIALFEGAGHSPHNERPGDFEALVRRFLQGELAEVDIDEVALLQGA